MVSDRRRSRHRAIAALSAVGFVTPSDRVGPEQHASLHPVRLDAQLGFLRAVNGRPARSNKRALGAAGASDEEALAAGTIFAEQVRTGQPSPGGVGTADAAGGGMSGGGSCEIPGYPTPPGGLAGVGLAWCPASVNFQVRVFALQAAGIQCSVAAVPDPPPEVVSRARSQIREVCGRLAALGTRLDGPNSGASCRCPAGFGP